jgi:hypothetical protein
MVGIEPPGENRLPAGPHRDLVLALHALYRGAGRPALRRIAQEINEAQDFPDTVSHETVSAILRGDGLPRWSKLESLVRQLVAWHHPNVDLDEQIERFLMLWDSAASSPISMQTGEMDTGLATDHGTEEQPRPSGSATGTSETYSRITPSSSAEVATRIPSVWGNVPQRNKNFIGRGEILEHLRRDISDKSAVRLPHALHGIIGAGKTTLAVEYAYRYLHDYDLVWWIQANQTAIARSSLAALAGHLDIHSGSATGIEAAIVSVLDALRRGIPYARWLLIFDDVDEPPEVINPIIPHGPGDVLITTRDYRWRGLVHSVPVNLFSRTESVELLTRQTASVINEHSADSLAEELGDLPLALGQAATLILDKSVTVEQYKRLLSHQPGELLREGVAPHYAYSIFAACMGAIYKLRQFAHARAFLCCCAFFGQQPVPLDTFRRDTSNSGFQFDEIWTNPISLGRAVEASGCLGLAWVDPERDAVQVHRLVQALLRNEMSAEEHDKFLHEAELLGAGMAGTDPSG